MWNFIRFDLEKGALLEWSWNMLMTIRSAIVYSNVKLNRFSKDYFETRANSFFDFPKLKLKFWDEKFRLGTTLKYKKGCGCTAAFFPKTINQTESPPCSIYDHVTCVKDHLVAFNQSARAKCNCQKDCVHSEPVAIHIQYGLEWEIAFLLVQSRKVFGENKGFNTSQKMIPNKPPETNGWKPSIKKFSICDCINSCSNGFYWTYTIWSCWISLWGLFFLIQIF